MTGFRPVIAASSKHPRMCLVSMLLPNTSMNNARTKHSNVSKMGDWYSPFSWRPSNVYADCAARTFETLKTHLRLKKTKTGWKDLVFEIMCANVVSTVSPAPPAHCHPLFPAAHRPVLLQSPAPGAHCHGRPEAPLPGVSAPARHSCHVIRLWLCCCTWIPVNLTVVKVRWYICFATCTNCTETPRAVLRAFGEVDPPPSIHEPISWSLEASGNDEGLCGPIHCVSNCWGVRRRRLHEWDTLSRP
jgi:hypothetical protein